MKYVEFFAIIIEYINYIVITIIIIARTLAWLVCFVFVLFVCLFVFLSLYFHNALYSDNEINRVDVLGHRFVLCPFQSYVSPRLATRTKMTLSQAQNIFIPESINYIVLFSFDLV